VEVCNTRFWSTSSADRSAIISLKLGLQPGKRAKLAKKRAISSLEGVITELFEELVLVLLV
jgi:hypothetical protein